MAPDPDRPHPVASYTAPFPRPLAADRSNVTAGPFAARRLAVARWDWPVGRLSRDLAAIRGHLAVLEPAA